ncbi:MAG: DUF4124 domain-containing protein [Bdellovibrionales bacterium]|nr:DUF4124 domain-containing protein [Bdellovibrionales bacterium]
MQRPIFVGALLTVGWLVLSPSVGSAEVYRFVDDQNRVHYVSSVEQVPQRFRSQVEEPAKLPPINRVPSSTFTPSSIPAVPSSRVEIFVADWCPYCKKLEAFLKRERVSYKRWDIEDNGRGKRRYLELGASGLPLIKINGNVIRGYNEAALRAELGL